MRSLNFPVPFTKMSGTGNDFIIIDHRKPVIADEDIPAFAKAICRRQFSVGADGLILVENHDAADFRWKFYNADGSEAEMCGNGARCVARFAHAKGIAPARMEFMTIAGVIEAQVVDGSVKVRLTTPTDTLLDRKIDIQGKTTTIHSINTGVPHAVHFVDEIRSAPVFEWGRIIRHDPLFQPAGANVNFVQIVSRDTLLLRTYERGIEDETMACGTGAVASSILAALLGHVEAPVTVTTSGGEQLTIHFSLDKDVPKDIFLEGPAHFIYEGNLDAEALQEVREPLC
ncbi:MAG: diaminopimelate epimerase [Desulfobulbaceae bacterium]|nr:diaminopimelate epimerase [Desulfobulbaceae bacterium]